MQFMINLWRCCSTCFKWDSICSLQIAGYAFIRKSDFQNGCFKKENFKNQRYSWKIKLSKLKKQLGQEILQWGVWHARVPLNTSVGQLWRLSAGLWFELKEQSRERMAGAQPGDGFPSLCLCFLNTPKCWAILEAFPCSSMLCLKPCLPDCSNSHKSLMFL